MHLIYFIYYYPERFGIPCPHYKLAAKELGEELN